MTTTTRILVIADGLHAVRCAAAVRSSGCSPVMACVPSHRHASWVTSADDVAVIPSGLRDISAIVTAALTAGCRAIHTGASKLTGDAELMRLTQAAGMVLIGPNPKAVNQVCPRHRLRDLAEQLEIPCDPARTPSTRTVAVTLAGREGALALLGDRDVTVCNGDDVILAESPAPELPLLLRIECFGAAQRLATTISASGLVDIRFHVDAEAGAFALADIAWGPSEDLDALSRALGHDLHAWLIRMALGEDPPWEISPLRTTDVGLAVRIARSSGPALADPGRCSGISLPESALCAITAGDSPSAVGNRFALLTACGEHRGEAYIELVEQLRQARLHGVGHDGARLHALLTSEAIRRARLAPALAMLPPGDLPALQVLEAGLQSTVQALPGRTGMWGVGVPPSGPMDDLALTLANRVVGNCLEAAGLETTFGAASFRFTTETIIALAGARTAARLDDAAVRWHEPITVPAGGVLRLGGIGASGQRTVIAIRGGLDVAECLGSAATFTLGGFGGHAGRALARGDDIPIGTSAIIANPSALPKEEHPLITREWTIGVCYGPHGAPEFFTPDDLDAFFSATWQVSPQSNRTGVRLIGPKPTWARRDGGEAGLHPSNIHDNAYALGSIDFTGDMPVMLGPDGPSLGGFVCPAVVAKAERWKIGQLRPGDTLRFHPLSIATAKTLRQQPNANLGEPIRETPILHREAEHGEHPALCLRRAGDDHLLIEVGDLRLDLALRMHVQALHDAIHRDQITGIIDLTPGVRSLQIHYNPDVIAEDRLIALVLEYARALPSSAELVVPSRTVYLPLSWDDPSTRKAIEIYQRTVNPDAPWCPWNIEFIRRINGLDSVDDVHRIVFDAEYLVLGLGDVYLGAPVATPVDPRHRLVTTKYNPARTWTPENAVGIGGAYMCIYGMEGPGGYQFVGRTIQVWNTWRSTDAFAPGTPWLLRQFDRIKFFPVSADELLQMREDFPHGRYKIRIEDGEFRMADHRRHLAQHAEEIAAFTEHRDAAFNAERERWALNATVPS